MAINPVEQLEVLSKRSIAGKQVFDIYRLLYHKEIWLDAYMKLYPNPGNMTRGTSEETIDGMSLKKIEDIVQQLKDGSFQFSPVRRLYIPKKDGKKRPLGVPNWRDKLTQEVMRVILEKIYEPVFDDNSHGFRPNRSCHTALWHTVASFKGTSWVIEGDITGFFDNIDHPALLAILRKKIKDEKFINLIRKLLKSGYMENWKFHNTFSGTPQGGIISPLLANIYLNELDGYMRRLKDEFKYKDYATTKPRTKESRRLETLKKKIRKYIKDNDSNAGKVWEGRKEQIKKFKEIEQQSFKVSYTGERQFKALQYTRYADDFIVGVLGSKKDAINLKERIAKYLKDELKLELSREKTKITNIKDGVPFLGYELVRATSKIVTQKNGIKRRTPSTHISPRIPYKKTSEIIKKFGYGDMNTARATKRNGLICNSELEILMIYNAELRGIGEYYKLARNFHRRLNLVFYMAEYSLYHTLAAKLRTTVPKIAAMMRKDSQIKEQGRPTLTIQSEKGPKHYTLVRSKDIKRHIKDQMCKKLAQKYDDNLPNTVIYKGHTELKSRLLANKCEMCGKENLPLQVHHIRKLKDLKKKNHLSIWDRRLIERRRKTLILCEECHLKAHGKVATELVTENE